MPRRNKHAARFGVRYRIPNGPSYLPVGFNIRRFAKAISDVQRMTEAMRRYHERQQAGIDQVEAVLGIPPRGIPHVSFSTRPPMPICEGDILDRIDDTLLTYDSQRATGEQPWPYGSF